MCIGDFVLVSDQNWHGWSYRELGYVAQFKFKFKLIYWFARPVRPVWALYQNSNLNSPLCTSRRDNQNAYIVRIEVPMRELYNFGKIWPRKADQSYRSSWPVRPVVVVQSELGVYFNMIFVEFQLLTGKTSPTNMKGRLSLLGWLLFDYYMTKATWALSIAFMHTLMNWNTLTLIRCIPWSHKKCNPFQFFS